METDHETLRPCHIHAHALDWSAPAPRRRAGRLHRGRLVARLDRDEPARRRLHDPAKHRSRARRGDGTAHRPRGDADDPCHHHGCAGRHPHVARGGGGDRPGRSRRARARRPARHAHGSPAADGRRRQLHPVGDLRRRHGGIGRGADPRHRGAGAVGLMRRRTFLRYGALGLGAVAATLFAGWWQVAGPGAPDPLSGRPMPVSALDFALIDHEGRPIGPETLVGRASLVFFGFTWCPQVCPTTLADISHWLDGLGTEAEALDVVLITVDPERDTVAAIAEYVGYFHPQIRGWTGSASEIARAAEGFRVRYEKVPLDGGDYTMNHTAGVFLFDADGALVSIIDYHEPREFALPKIRRAMARSATVPGAETG